MRILDQHPQTLEIHFYPQYLFKDSLVPPLPRGRAIREKESAASASLQVSAGSPERERWAGERRSAPGGLEDEPSTQKQVRLSPGRALAAHRRSWVPFSLELNLRLPS